MSSESGSSSSSTRSSRSSSCSSIELFPSWDAEPIIRPRIEDTPAYEVVVGGTTPTAEEVVDEIVAEAAVEYEMTYGRREDHRVTENVVENVIVDVPIDTTDPLQVMLRRLAQGIKVYQDPSYGSRRCLFDPKNPIPQEVTNVPTTYQLFLSAPQNKDLQGYMRSAAWIQEKATGRLKEWEQRCLELKMEQDEQVKLGVIHVKK